MATGQTDAARAIEALSEAFARHLNAGDANAAVRSFYAVDASLLPPGHAMVSGQRQVRDALQGLLDAGMGDVAMETVKVEQSGDLAYRIGRYSLGKPAPDRGKFVEVHRRQADGSWKCIADIFNSDQAAG